MNPDGSQARRYISFSPRTTDINSTQAKSVPLTVCVTHQRLRRYFATGVKVSSMKEYEALFSKSNAAIEIRKELRKVFDQICAKTDELILLNRFSVADLKSHIEKSEGKVTEKTMRG